MSSVNLYPRVCNLCGGKVEYTSNREAGKIHEDLARMVERGIYDLSTWVAGMKFLPEPSKLPDCFKVLQFQEIPQTEKEITDRFKQLAKSAHPDAGGTDDQFRLISETRDKALEYLKGEKV